MRIALLSDIHSNLPALLSVLDDINKRRPDAVYCLGDLVGYAPWPNEVIAEIRKRKIPVIAGNYDQGIGLHGDDCGCAYKTDEEKAMGKISISYTNQIIGNDERKYLRSLPSQMNINFRPNESESFNLLMVHGSPRRINEYLFEDREEKSLLRIMESADADIMVFGHTHKPYHRILSDETGNVKRFRHAINTGSVGKPKDGDKRACYVMLQLDENSSMQVSESIKPQFIRVAYDFEKTAKAIENSPLPAAYAEMIRNAY